MGAVAERFHDVVEVKRTLFKGTNNDMWVRHAYQRTVFRPSTSLPFPTGAYFVALKALFAGPIFMYDHLEHISYIGMPFEIFADLHMLEIASYCHHY